jgi:hypothetical protein
MALSLGVSCGDRISVDGHILEVKNVSGFLEMVVIVSVDGAPGVVLTELSRVELIPGVKVFVGRGKMHARGTYRLAFEAHRSIRIDRHSLPFEPTRPRGATSPRAS